MGAVKQCQIEEMDRDSFKEMMRNMIDSCPGLCYEGWHYVGKNRSDFEDSRIELYDKEKEVRTVVNYLFFFPAPKGRRGGGSYGFKHDVEQWAKQKYGEPQYISNGSGILGALMSGYIPKRHNLSPNCGFTKSVTGEIR
jgi:hypothetical protein